MNYVKIGPVSEAGPPQVWYQLRVRHGTWKESVEMPSAIQRTLTGAGSKSFGKAYKVWAFTAVVKPTEDTGYATLAKLESLMQGSTVAANQVLVQSMRYDLSGNGDAHAYPAFFAVAFTYDLVATAIGNGNSGARFLVPIVLQQYADPAS